MTLTLTAAVWREIVDALVRQLRAAGSLPSTHTHRARATILTALVAHDRERVAMPSFGNVSIDLAADEVQACLVAASFWCGHRLTTEDGEDWTEVR